MVKKGFQPGNEFRKPREVWRWQIFDYRLVVTPLRPAPLPLQIFETSPAGDPVRPRAEQFWHLKRFHIAPDLHEHILDRKSTRLNSSHRCISYAVFCLKKKKTQ